MVVYDHSYMNGQRFEPNGYRVFLAKGNGVSIAILYDGETKSWPHPDAKEV